MAAEQTDENRRDMLTETEIDVIGEILNISMGSASTALSAMLDKQVTITTPALEQNRFGELDYSDMDPAIMVKINYVEGISGSNVIVFRSRDMQIILNLLMGNEEIPPEDSQFEFDDMTMSAACEVMNQMMGSSATALSEVLGRIVNISTPTAHISEIGTCIASDLMEMNDDDVVVCVSFSLMVENIMDSNFISFLSIPLARDIISSVMPEDGSEIQPLAPIPETTAEEGLAQAAGEGPGEAASGSAEEAPDPMPSPEAITQPPQQAAEAPAPMPAPEAITQLPPQQAAEAPTPMPPPMPSPMPPQGAAAQPPTQPTPQQGTPVYAQAEPPPPAQAIQDQWPPQHQAGSMAGQQPWPPQDAWPNQPPPYGMDINTGQRMVNMVTPMNQFNIKRPQFPDFSEQVKKALADGGNLSLLMGVPLEVSIVIGKTRRKIKDILEFGQGTVLELEKQTGAPAEIIVNGQLLAYGDVIVIGDNFGVRITEIVGTKELMDSLDEQL